MSNPHGSHLQILRSSSIIGGASLFNVLIGLVRTKLLAILLGPTGVGIVGLLQNVLTTGSSVASLGLSTAGTRQIAEANGLNDHRALSEARQALFWATCVLSLLGAATFWLARDLVAVRVFSSSVDGTQIGWLSLGVGLAVAAGSQTALLNGLRRVSDLALISISAALVSSVLGVAAIIVLGREGLALFVISGPAASFVLGHYFVRKLKLAPVARSSFVALRRQWATTARLGVAFMLSGLVASLGQLVIRFLVQGSLGTEALGHFQAAWAISMTYVGFVLAAMGTDFYPRLTAAIRDPAQANQLMNEQSEVALILSGPVFLLVLGFAPWVIQLLYSSAFAEAASVLRWQVLGDVLKVASWPLGFAILAAGDGRTFMAVETLAMAVYIAVVWVSLPLLGLDATGVGFLAMYASLLFLNHLAAARRTRFRWRRSVLLWLVLLLAFGALICSMAQVSETGAMVLGFLASVSFAMAGMTRLSLLVPPESRLGRAGRPLRAALGMVTAWRVRRKRGGGDGGG